MSILNPDQNQVMSRMTDDMIRQRIREYCVWDRQKNQRSELWIGADPRLTITEINKDEKGWYIDTNSAVTIYLMFESREKLFYDYCSSCGQKIDKQKGFLIEDIGVYFRWRKHNGILEISDSPNLESTDGLPEELDVLSLWKCCRKSKKLNVRDKINILDLTVDGDLKISGDGCENVIINPDSPGVVTVPDEVTVPGEVTAPSGTKIYYPKDYDEYVDLRDKLIH